MEKLIAVVDDEEDLRALVAIHLKKAGFKVKEYADGDTFLKTAPKSMPDLAILDIMMPGTDGLEACKLLKADHRTAHIPVIMLTAKVDESDKIVGLDTGADDYVTKPFSPRELVARVRAVLRRGAGTAGSEGQVKAGAISVDTQKHEASVRGKPVELTATEFNILHLLVSKPGRVFSREQLLDNLWGNEKVVVDRTVDVHIKHLRTKLGPAGKAIKNIRGVGYKLEK